MLFVDHWVRTEKTPVPLKEIIKEMENQGVHDFTVLKSINVLLKKGYIRRAIMVRHRAAFVQIRTV